MVNLQIGAAYRNLKEYDKAIAAYNVLLTAEPDNQRAILGVAMTNMDKGDLQAAERTLTQAADAPLSSREIFYNLGRDQGGERPDRRSGPAVSEGGRCRHLVGKAAVQARARSR